jgi:hypothetical protein
MYVMKKFYLLIMALVGYASTSLAQPFPDPPNPPQCPAAMQAKYYLVPATTPYYKIFIGGGPIVTPPSTALVSLVQPAALGGQPVPDLGGVIFTSLDNTGGATVEYASTYNVHHIEVEVDIAGNHYTCKYLADAGGALPIKLTAFNGKLNTETEATLAWTSSLEENSFQYEVQRSADGRTFTTVGKVTAKGTSFDAVKYSFNDPLPGAGAYYYRLKMVDLDGKSELSKVVYVNSKKGNGIVTKIFPNPFKSEIQLIGATSADLNTQGNIKVFNVSGQQVGFRIVGANAIAIDPNAGKGLYFINIKTAAQNQIFKVIKD